MKTLAIWTLLASSALAQQTVYTELVAAVRRTYPGNVSAHLTVNEACGKWHDKILAQQVSLRDQEAELRHYKAYLATKGIDVCKLQMSRQLAYAFAQY